MYSDYRKEDRTVSDSKEKKLMNRKDDKGSWIVCELSVGEHLRRIIGLDFAKAAYDYEVIEEYTYHYVIKITCKTGFANEKPTYICTSVSKAAIYCGHVVLIKEDGSKVRAREEVWDADEAS